MKTSKNSPSKPVYWPVIISALIFTPLAIPLLFIVGVLHFGFVSGPDPRNLALWVSYILLSSSPAALIFAKILKKRVDQSGRFIRYRHALIVALVSLSFIQSSIVIITVYNFGEDTFTFLSGLALALFSSIILTDILSVKTSQQRK